jgi:hypothetical protein
MDSSHRIAERLVHKSGKAVKVAPVGVGGEVAEMLARSGRVAGMLVRLRKGILIDSVGRLKMVCGAQIRNSVCIVKGPQTEDAEAVVGLETAGLMDRCGSKSGLVFATKVWPVIRLKVQSIPGQFFARTEARVGAMTSGCRPVGNAGDGETRFVGKLHGLRGRSRSLNGFLVEPQFHADDGAGSKLDRI